MYFEKEEMREDMVNLAIGIIDDFSGDEEQMKEELQMLLDSDEEGIFLEAKTYKMIVKGVDNDIVRNLFLEHIRKNAPENLNEILE